MKWLKSKRVQTVGLIVLGVAGTVYEVYTTGTPVTPAVFFAALVANLQRLKSDRPEGGQ